MARALIDLTIFIYIFVSSLSTSLSISTDHLLLPPSDGNDRRSMVLPLFHSPPNSSTVFSYPRRHLHGSEPHSQPNARMRLYDDLLINGYYTTRLWIGTPPQTFALIIDTGSTVTYVPCSTCEQCGRHQDPKFQPDLSSTYQPVECNMDCNCDNDRVHCVYERQYAEMSTSSGILGEDIISFGNLSELAPQRAVFGCENVETGDLYSQHADGIMGLGRGDLSVVDQLLDKGVINDSFSLCYGGMDVGGGAMILGGISAPADMVFANSDPVRSPYYNVDLKEMHVAGKRLPLNQRVFDGKHGAVLDSGTTYAYLPEAAFVAFKAAIMAELHSLKQIHGPDPNYNDICFNGGTSDVSQLPKIFPAVEMVFGKGQKLLLSPENYLFQHSKVRGAYCLGIFQNGKDPTTLLGGIVVRNTLVMYDREHLKIGFWKTNCSELWERLRVSDTLPPLPSPSKGNDSSIKGKESSSKGSNSTEDKIGEITFDMSVSVNVSDLKPRMPELEKLIAKELDINASQIHLSNFTSGGNQSLLSWGIYPPGSANYITNGTANSIIFQLTEHRMQLPDSFGHYELISLEIKHPDKQTWWEVHYWVVVVAIISTTLIGLSGIGIWFIWRQKQLTLNSYKPVDGAVPEQEMQPL